MTSRNHAPPPLDEHSVELTAELDFGPRRRRRTLAALSVVLCLTGAGVILGLAGVRSERMFEAKRAVQANPRQEVRIGQQTTVGTAAPAAQLAATASTPSASPVARAASVPTTTALSRKKPPPRRRSNPLDAPAVPSGSFHASTDRPFGASESDFTLPSESTKAPSGDIPGGNASNGSVPGSLPNPALPNGSSGTTLPGLPNVNGNSSSGLP